MFCKYAALLLCIVISFSLCSCSKTKTKEEILKEAENYTSTSVEYDSFAYQADIGKWLEPELKYKYDYGDSSDRINNLMAQKYIQHGERLYFQISREVYTENSYYSGYPLWAYISLDTGEKHYLCPDPLCSHLAGSECQYLNLSDLLFHPESDNILYALRHEFINGIGQDIIYKIDLENNKIKKVYAADKINSGTSYNKISLFFISKDCLYFKDQYITENRDENGEVTYTENTYLMSLNLSTEKTEVINSDFNEYSECVYAVNDSVYFNDQYEHRFYKTDMNFENEKTILKYDENSYIYDMYYDISTEEFYILVCSSELISPSSMNIDTDKVSGSLYKIDSRLNCEKLSMPSDLLLDIQLTDNYIYYTVYDPVQYGVTRLGKPTIDGSGNKIYRVNRSDTEKSELIFDGHNELLFYGNFFAVGDYLYIDYYKITERDGGGTYFLRTGSVARINMTDNTIKWINLD